MPSYDAVVIGAGPNGLVAAAYLAKAGKKVLVLERRPRVGGIAATEEIFPGFKYFPGAQLAGTFSREIVAELDLENHGLKILPLDPLLFAPALSGESLLIPRDRAEAVREIGRFSKRDADTFPAFCSLIDKLTAFLRHLYGLPLPGGTGARSLSLAHLIKVGIRFRRLGKREMHEFLRILPMSIADLLNEWFENEKLKAALAASAILGSFVGPRAQGTAYVFLHHLATQSGGVFRASGFVSGGIHKLPEALLRAAQQYGAEVRTGAEVASIATPNGKAGSVVLANGEEISASAVVSSADVKRTFLGLVAPTYLDPHFLLQVKNIRARGTVARINFALDGLPNFKHGSSTAAAAQLAGIIHIGPTLDYLERAADDAKYGRFSRQPFLEITIPSIADPSVAPQGKHVMSVWMQSAPYSLREGDWNHQRQALGTAVIDAIESYAPGFKRSILHAHVWTPVDLEQTLGVTGGHLDHAELGLDQIFFMRPVPGWADYSTPIENLYLCGSGTHPGGGVTGRPGYYAAARILKDTPARK